MSGIWFGVFVSEVRDSYLSAVSYFEISPPNFQKCQFLTKKYIGGQRTKNCVPGSSFKRGPHLYECALSYVRNKKKFRALLDGAFEFI